jgi:hypothetical protein
MTDEGILVTRIDIAETIVVDIVGIVPGLPLAAITRIVGDLRLGGTTTGGKQNMTIAEEMTIVVAPTIVVGTMTGAGMTGVGTRRKTASRIGPKGKRMEMAVGPGS